MSAASPYLGCKISLISKAEIRYEGLLYSIDAQESTVALANVRSFGTENRPTERPIPPRNEVFELIIFRGSDIKDLHVSEPPTKTAAPAAPWPQDPAIVEASQPIPAGRAGTGDFLPPILAQAQAQKPLLPAFGAQPGFVMPYMTGVPASTTQPVAAPATKPVTQDAISSPSAPTTANQNNVGHSYASQLQNTLVKTSDSKSTNAQSDSPALEDASHQAEEQRPKSQPSQQQRDRNNDGSKPAAGRGRTLINRPPGPPQDHGHNNRGGGRPRGGHDGGSWAPRGRPGQMSARQQGRPAQPNAPRIEQEEFDFESSNAKFDKEKFEKEFEEKLAVTDDKGSEAEKEEADAANQFYDKKKSFFDNISCQALDTEPTGRGRGNADSRRLNSETFGSAVFRGRRGGGGRGGRGGYGPPRPRDQGMYRPKDGGRMYGSGPPDRGYGRRMNNGGRFDGEYDERRRPGRGRGNNEY